MASSSRLKPGEKGKIKVAVDVRGRRGRMVKKVQVSTNDPKTPRVILVLKMRVTDRIHMKKYGAAEIFKGSCSGCHIGRGKSMKGFALFLADCMTCHGTGKSGLSIVQMRTKKAGEIERAIRQGVRGTSMPGWDPKHGGPLTDEQIRGLVDAIIPAAGGRKGI
jgi:hypothetical protein